MAAYPGTSAHGVGLALDFEQDATVGPFDWGQPGSVWLTQNSSKYGFYNPFSYGTTDESYHFQFE
ncbi:D-alanyl-D-alanine carboxypeptidase family protein [Rudaeicoccus suwonensis]|uniref:D-alanyl-D-alanine carboxypeptidase family protein n=1 Tax=Rudaeicoccus suwonensis TaxID=657409 RepID=UPI0011A211E3|nr:D-alanyl-D-alanine carboxypeptidase family protein [Rudaeicoccus suwonensis]